jgi:lipopolysaccharide biosynthesis glycosyltransferase
MYNIILISDHNSIKGLFTLINSIVINCTNISIIKFNILLYELTNEINNILSNYNNLNIEVKQFKNHPKENFLINNITVHGGNKFNYINNLMNFSRLYITDLFPFLKTALYLDTDMICQVDILTLFNQNIQTKQTPFYIASPLIRDLSTMDYNPPIVGKGFNTGFYLINLDLWKKNNYIDLAEKLIINNKKNKLFKLGTQPILNLIYYKKCTSLDKKWNLTGLGSYIFTESKLNKAYILHWSGPHKPWNEDGLNKERWEKYVISNQTTSH